ncbi:HU family DNA-binding protein [Alicyclobacillus fastidiosus]|uniref:HU family DNA-binding protein n=1 Tax=Alicyclobacillus fastidiosus TaxID=392011 RepID=A0ABV5AHS7_9BACL|nr:HU family DNA-binding protein [Alicyclobacillus fastidiosus]WEH09187.1 HU family DNA-binding protein [Alicyclobacillus fastidiosus]
MNKTELIKSIATGANVPQAVAGKVLTALQESIENALMHGEKVSVRGFGSFTISEHSARRFHHPATGEKLMAAAFRTVRFTPSTQIKSSLN